MRNDIYRAGLTCTDFTTCGRVTGMTGHGAFWCLFPPPQKKYAGQKNIAQRNPTKYHGIHWKIRTVIFSHGVQHSLMDEIGLIRGHNL